MNWNNDIKAAGAEMERPKLAASIETAHETARSINQRLEAMLSRVRPPQLQPIGSGTTDGSIHPPRALLVTAEFVGKEQNETHVLITELERFI